MKYTNLQFEKMLIQFAIYFCIYKYLLFNTIFIHIKYIITSLYGKVEDVNFSYDLGNITCNNRLHKMTH